MGRALVADASARPGSGPTRAGLRADKGRPCPAGSDSAAFLSPDGRPTLRGAQLEAVRTDAVVHAADPAAAGVRRLADPDRTGTGTIACSRKAHRHSSGP
ncbi:hypothetical protein ACFXAF_13925 [Kitasatospora sp. NPDC059463]|uniref:hypothetical protein n=1 Tax=unclassified Kitasatospora TaxID=2633591 RepID=UPI003684DB8B